MMFCQDVERESSRLDRGMDELGVFVDSLSEENQGLDPLVRQATEHAYDLMRQAQTLAGSVVTFYVSGLADKSPYLIHPLSAHAVTLYYHLNCSKLAKIPNLLFRIGVRCA